MSPDPSDNAPYEAVGCADCTHVKRIHLANVGRCLVTNCDCPTYDPPTAGLTSAMERGEWP